jgi:hypothetical protein
MSWDEHMENRNKVREELLRPYFGKHVAWSADGTRIVASGRDDLEVFKAAMAAGFDTNQVVFSYLPLPDEVILGGVIASA